VLSLICLAQLGALGTASYLYLKSRRANANLKARLEDATSNRMELSFGDFGRLYANGGPPRLTDISYDVPEQVVKLFIDGDEPCQFSCAGNALGKAGGCVAVPFPLVDQDGVTSQTVLVVHGSGTDTITIRYYPPKFYGGMGVESKGNLIIDTTLPRSARPSGESASRIREQQAELLK